MAGYAVVGLGALNVWLGTTLSGGNPVLYAFIAVNAALLAAFAILRRAKPERADDDGSYGPLLGEPRERPRSRLY